MRIALLGAAFLLILSSAQADDCRGYCNSRCCNKPESSYNYENAYFAPNCSPRSIQRFHDRLVPMMEARKSGEASYIRDTAERLYWSASKLRKLERGCCKIERRRFDLAAKKLMRACEELRDTAFGGSSAAVYARMRDVEEAYIQVANLAE